MVCQSGVEAGRGAIKAVVTSTLFASCADVRYDMPLVILVQQRGVAMPTMRKLTPDEVQTLQTKAKGPRKLVEEQYDAILGDYAVGDYGEAELTPDESRLTVRNRLRAAAGRHGFAIEFKRTTGDLLRFYIPENNGTEAADTAPDTSRNEPTPVGTQRKGRKKQET